MLNVAVIGTGNISRAHIEGYLKFPERCRIVAFVDILPHKAEEKKRDYGLDGVEIYDSHKKLLERGGVDLVSIATPPFAHAPIAIDCLDAGVNVLVEKPMAMGLDECDAMLAAAERSGKMLAVVSQQRFGNEAMGLKRVLESGLAGRVVHAQADSHWWRGHNYYDLWWRGKKETEGGGCTLNHAVHHIDLLMWMMGMPAEVTAVISNANHDNSEVEDISVAALRYPDGSVAQITSSVIHHGEEQQMVFQCENARVSAPWKVVASTQKPNGFPLPDAELEKKLDEFRHAVPELAHTGHTGLIENVLTALETGARPLVDGHSGRAAVEMITAIYKAGSEKRTVTLPLAPDDPFYTFEGVLAYMPRFYEKTASVEELSGDISIGSAYNKLK